jgi:hypothetical protein
MENIRDYIIIFEDALKQEIAAEKYSAELMEIFKNNGENLEMSAGINQDEIKHQKIVKEILSLLKG